MDEYTPEQIRILTLEAKVVELETQLERVVKISARTVEVIESVSKQVGLQRLAIVEVKNAVKNIISAMRLITGN